MSYEKENGQFGPLLSSIMQNTAAASNWSSSSPTIMVNENLDKSSDSSDDNDGTRTTFKSSRRQALNKTPRIANFHKQSSFDSHESSDETDGLKTSVTGEIVIASLDQFYQSLIKDITRDISLKIGDEIFDKNGKIKTNCDENKIKELYEGHKSRNSKFAYNEKCPPIVKDILTRTTTRFLNIHLKKYIITTYNEALQSKEVDKKSIFLKVINDFTDKSAPIRPDYEILSLLQNNVYNNRDMAMQMYVACGYAPSNWSLNGISANAHSEKNQNGHKQSRFNNLCTSMRENFGENFGTFFKSAFPFAMVDGDDFAKIKKYFTEEQWLGFYNELSKGNNPFDKNDKVHLSFVKETYAQHLEVYKYYKSIIESDFYGILHGKTFPSLTTLGKTNNPNPLTGHERTMAKISVGKIAQETYNYAAQVIGEEDAKKLVTEVIGKDEAEKLASKNANTKPIWERVKETVSNHEKSKQQPPASRTPIKAASIKVVNNEHSPEKFTKDESKHILKQVAGGTLHIAGRSKIANVKLLVALKKNNDMELDLSDSSDNSSPKISTAEVIKPHSVISLSRTSSIVGSSNTVIDRLLRKKSIKSDDATEVRAPQPESALSPKVEIRRASAAVPVIKEKKLDRLPNNPAKKASVEVIASSSNSAINRLLTSKSIHKTLVANGEVSSESAPRLLTRAECNQKLADDKSKIKPKLTRQYAKVWTNDDLKIVGITRSKGDRSI